MIFRSHKIVIIGLLAVIILAACSGPNPTAQPTAPATTAPEIIPTPTPEPPEELTVCLGREPQSLYIYANSSRSQWSVLEAIYDGPIDRVDYIDQPVILTSLPSAANGDSVLTAVDVQRGQIVLNASGNLAVLDTGTQVLPAGCTTQDCAVTWDGISPLQMDQQQITYRLINGLTWSDGMPLTVDDSIYSYEIASDPSTPLNRRVIDLTESYTALDSSSLTWKGIPGYRAGTPAAYFFLPLPRHAWGGTSPAELLTADAANRAPLGWGPFVIESWTAGESITLTRNPNYFRASEGLPRYDRITFRFLGDQPDNNLVALAEGICDVVDETTLLEEQLQSVRNMTINEKIKMYVSLGPEWEHLDFGIVPASYDAGYNLFSATRQDIFGDLRMRQAVASCIDRQTLINELLYNQSQIPAGFFPPDHPLYAADLPQLPFDPAHGMQLLDETGWIDHDSDPATPRQAAGAANVLDGTQLSLTYATTTDRLRTATANRIAAMLGECGIKVTVQTQDAGALFSPGPGGPLFGRNFDLAQFSWQSGTGSPCFLYTNQQIPTAENNWLGANITGWANSEFDAACQAALVTNPDDTVAYQAANRQVQEIFASELPVLPLYYSIRVTASRTDLCGFTPDSSARSDFWNLENIAGGTACP